MMRKWGIEALGAVSWDWDLRPSVPARCLGGEGLMWTSCGEEGGETGGW